MSTGATVIGKVAIKVVPESGDFRRDAQRALNRIEKQLDPINVKLDLAATSKEKVRAELASLTRRREVTITPKINKAAAAKVASTLAALSGGRSIRDLGSDIADWAGELDKQVPKIAATALAVTNLASVALTGSANLLSLGASLASTVGAGLALPGILGGIAIGLGATFAVLKDFNKRLPEVKGKISELQNQMSDRFWNRAEEPIRNLVNSLLPEITKGLDGTSDSLGRFFANLANSANGQFGGELQGMFNDLNKSVRIAAGDTDVFVGIIQKLGSVGAGNLPRLARWFGDISEKFNNFLANKGESGLQQIVDEGISALSDLGGVITGTGSLLAGLSRAAEQSGASTLATLDRTVNAAAKKVNGAKFQNALSDAFAGARTGIDELTNRSGKQFESLMLRISDLLSHALPRAGKTAGKALGAIFGALDQPQVEKAILGFFDNIDSAVNSLAPSLPSVARGLAAVVDVIGQITTNVARGIAPVLTALGDSLPGLASDFRPLISELGDLIENAGELTAAVLPDTISLLGSLAGALTDAVRPINAVADAFDSLPSPITTVLKALAAMGLLVAGGAWLGVGVRAKIGQFGKSVTLAGQQAVVGQKALYAMGSTAQRVTSRISGLRSGAALAAVAIGQIAVQSAGANTALGQTATIASDALAGFALGGPIGAAIGVGVAGFQNFTNHLKQFKTAMQEADDAARSHNIEAIGTSLEKIQGQIDHINMPIDTNHGFFSLLKSAGSTGFDNIYDRLVVKPQLLDSLSNLQESLGTTDAFASVAARSLGLTVDQFNAGVAAADSFSGALSRVNGWFDKRQAIRDYNDALRTLTKGLKDGFTRADVENLDQVGRSILQVANSISSKKKRSNFIQDEIAQLTTLADSASPKAKAAIDEVIKRLNTKTLTDPTPTKLTADDRRLRATLGDINPLLTALGKKDVTPTVSLGTGNAFTELFRLQAEMAGIKNKTVTITVITNHRGGVTSTAGGHSSDAADGKRAADGYSAGFAKELTKLLNKIQDQYQKAIDKAGKHAQALKDKFADSIKQFRQLANEHAKLEKQLDSAQAKLQGYQDQQTAFAESVRSTVVASADVTTLGVHTYDGLIRALGKARDKAIAFKDTILELISGGLNKTTLQQILAAGPEAGLAIAKSILAGGVSQVNDIQAQIDAAAQIVGDASGQHFFGDLVANAQSDVDKLLAQLGPLQARLQKFAHDLIASLSKALKKEWKSQMGDGGSSDAADSAPGPKGGNVPKPPSGHRNAAPSIGKQVNLTYIAAPGKSISSEEELWEALDRAG